MFGLYPPDYCDTRGIVQAINLQGLNEALVWQLKGEVLGKGIKPWGVFTLNPII